jgi:hypothetical protein
MKSESSPVLTHSEFMLHLFHDGLCPSLIRFRTRLLFHGFVNRTNMSVLCKCKNIREATLPTMLKKMVSVMENCRTTAIISSLYMYQSTRRSTESSERRSCLQIMDDDGSRFLEEDSASADQGEELAQRNFFSSEEMVGFPGRREMQPRRVRHKNMTKDIHTKQ